LNPLCLQALTLQGKMSAGLSSVGLLLDNTLGDAPGTLLVGTAVGELVAAAVVGEDDVGPAVVGDTLGDALGDTLGDTLGERSMMAIRSCDIPGQLSL
jgi:hypothetical protein